MKNIKLERTKVGIVGLGYVGLPLAVALSKKYQTIGFDIDLQRISDLEKGIDYTNELTTLQVKEAIENRINFTNNPNDLDNVNFYIVTVPTPIKKDKTPNLDPLVEASRTVARFLKKEDIVVYESTVYPGVTEEVCVPILEMESGLKFNEDFTVGYSPERINPGDKKHTLTKIKKVVSGSTVSALKEISKIYASVIEAGIFEASCIKVAEAAKVIENTQRDINIAFINELAVIFNKMQIDIYEVLEAAGTKWNFLNFKPGLVGGHCIGVDPYYLAQRAKEYGHNPEMILAGRRINDSMAEHVFNLITKECIKRNLNINTTRFLIYGLTFKEDCPDFRNSQSHTVYKLFKDFNLIIKVQDPYLEESNQSSYNKADIASMDSKEEFDVLMLLVPHQTFKEESIKISKDGFVFDLKNHLVSSSYNDIIKL